MKPQHYKPTTLAVGALAALALSVGTSAHAQNITSDADRVVKVLRTTNKAQTNRYVPKVYEFQNANPFDVRAYIQRALEVEEGGMFTFVNPEGTGGLFLVICPEYQIPYLDKLVAKLDRPGQTTINKWQRTYEPTKHRSVLDAAFVSTLFQFGGPDMAAGFLGDAETNCLRYIGAPSSIENILAGLKVLDVPTPQARLEIALYEVDVQNDGSLGLDYISWKNGPGRNLFAVGAYAERQHVTDLYGDSNFIYGDTGRGVYGLPGHKMHAKGANAAYNLNVNSAYFDFLAAKGKARTINKASVSAMTATPFSVESIDRVFFTKARTGDANALRDPNEPLDAYGEDGDFPDNRTVVFDSDEIGISLEGLVWLGEEGSIVVDLENSVSTLSGYSGTGVPLINEQSYETTLTLSPGEEIVIGGLSRQRIVEGGSKIPVLGSLPVIGWLFGGEKDLSQKTMVVCALRAVRVEDMSGLTVEDDTIMSRAKGELPVTVEPAPVGFDQWGLDQ